MKRFGLVGGGSIPALGLGTWLSPAGEVGPVIREAIRQGYRHIDCARAYGNEAEIGKALEAAFAAGDVRREDLFVTSKLWNDAHEPDRVRPALERTLKDLRLDHLDLYLIHWPVALKPKTGAPKSADDFFDPTTLPVLATWRALEACAREGLVRHLGVSNFGPRRVEELVASAEVPVAVNQVERHPLLAQRDLLARCAAHDVHVTAYAPLGSRGRPASMANPEEPNLFQHPVIARIAEGRHATPAQVLLAWGIARGTSVIPKTTHPDRLRENLAAADLALPPEDLGALDALDRGHRFVDGTFWCQPFSPWTLTDLWA